VAFSVQKNRDIVARKIIQFRTIEESCLSGGVVWKVRSVTAVPFLVPIQKVFSRKEKDRRGKETRKAGGVWLSCWIDKYRIISYHPIQSPRRRLYWK